MPTIGGRPEYLPLALKSIREAGEAYILLIGIHGFDASEFLASGLIDAYLDEPVSNLAEKINFGIHSLPPEVQFVNWLGDDDLLTPRALSIAQSRLESDKSAVLVYGGCEYIDSFGDQIWMQKSGSWAIPLLRFGPQLVPQPGSLYRRSAFETLGGLSADYGWAFDFKLFLELSKIGDCVFVDQTLAKFRWHPGSLSVSRRRESVNEASRVRVQNLPRSLRLLSQIWEWPIREATYWAGICLSRRLAN